jgi:hypothetical protein
MNQEKTKSLHIDSETHLRLKIYSAIEKIPINEVVRRFIKKGLNEEDKKKGSK